jgi:hypothetical protein
MDGRLSESSARKSCGNFGISDATSYYTARNATDLLQVADFTGLLQDVNKLQQAC